MATKYAGSILSPDQFGGGVEKADPEIAIDDHHGLMHLLQCGQQQIRGFDFGNFACLHHSNPDARHERTEARPRGRGIHFHADDRGISVLKGLLDAVPSRRAERR